MRKLTPIALATAIAVSGCASLAERHLASPAEESRLTEQLTPGYIPRKLVEEGMRYLEKRDLENAGRLFNAAVKFSPDRYEVHLLSGLVYHLEFLRGTPQSKDLAEVAFQLAGRQMPTSHLPHMMLGRLHLDSGQHQLAYDELARALELRPSQADVMLDMMRASYLTGDIKTALWLADEMEKTGTHADSVNRLKAVLLMASGQSEQSRRYALRYLSSAGAISDDVRGRFSRRLDEIGSLVRDGLSLDEGRRRSGLSTISMGSPDRITAKSDATGGIPLVLAQAPANPGMAAPGVVAQGATPYGVQGQMAPQGQPMGVQYGAQPVYPGAYGHGYAAPAANVPTLPPPRRKWFECGDTNPAAMMMGAPGGMPYGGGAYGAAQMPGMGMTTGGTGGDETSALPALPAPCVGEPNPRMAVIDAVMVRTEEIINRSYGVNLLQNLSAFFSYSRTYTSTAGTTGGTTGDTAVVSRAWGLSQPGSFLSYALNIANSANSRNEVIARPSLLAIDRMPSSFFSGSQITLGIAGAAGSASTVTDRQVGISLSVTPTFVDNDTVMLAVKATRSFVQPGVATGSSFGQQLNTSRNAVTANVSVKFGETLILSGLTEREVQRGDSGVPVLKNVPGLQYLFDSVINSDFNRTVLIMITPRKPVISEADIQAARLEVENKGSNRVKRYAFHWRLKEYEEVLSRYAPNLDTVVLSLRNNQLYRNFSSRDLVDDTWAAQEPLKKFTRDLKELIYH
jgi:general secretion pathway protein D